jgi:hypothetical protein
VELVKTGDGRRKALLADWNKWMGSADELYGRFLDRVRHSPFYYHEVASTGFLAAAAAMAGFVPLAEYEILKRGRDDARTKSDGRADLWFSGGRLCYSFEMKRAYLSATRKNLSAVLNEAARDIGCIGRDEYHYGAGCLITRIRDVERMQIYREFAQCDEVDICFRIGPDGEDGAFLFFQLVQNAN